MSECLLPRYRVSRQLEDFIKSQAGPHFVCDTGTCMTDLAALERWKEQYGDNRFSTPIPVYPYKEDSPFSCEGDAAYQAWHDRLHAEGEYEFTISGEIRLAGLHMALTKRAGLADSDCMFLYHFIVSRVMYQYWHDGNDPPDRARFISACFQYGCQSAARGDYEMQYADYCSWAGFLSSPLRYARLRRVHSLIATDSTMRLSASSLREAIA